MPDEFRNLSAEAALWSLSLQLQILLYYRAEGGRMSGLCGPTMFGVILITRYRACLSSAAHIPPANVQRFQSRCCPLPLCKTNLALRRRFCKACLFCAAAAEASEGEEARKGLASI